MRNQENEQVECSAYELLKCAISKTLEEEVWDRIASKLNDWKVNPLKGDDKCWADKHYGEHATSRILMVYIREHMYEKGLLGTFRAKFIEKWYLEVSALPKNTEPSFLTLFPHTVLKELELVAKADRTNLPLFTDDGYTYRECELKLARKTRKLYDDKKHSYLYANEFDHIVTYLIGVLRCDKSRFSGKTKGLKSIQAEICNLKKVI